MNLSVILFLILSIFGIFFLIYIYKKDISVGSSKNDVWPFYAKSVLSQPEQILYHRLVKSLPEHIVLAQVQVSRVLGVKKEFKFNEWNNRINRLSYDFVICSKDSEVLAVIELDDKSHERSNRIQTDAKKSKATSSSGIPLIRWNVKSIPDEITIQTAILHKLSV